MSWLGERSVFILSSYHPVYGAGQGLVVNENMLLGLVERLRNKCGKPIEGIRDDKKNDPFHENDKSSSCNNYGILSFLKLL